MLSTLLICYVDCHSWQLCNFPSNIIILSLFAFTCTLQHHFNGVGLIMFTLLLHVRHVFSFFSRLRSHLGWSNVSIFLIIILLNLIIKFILVSLLFFQTSAYDIYSRLNPTDLVVQWHICPTQLGNLSLLEI